MIAKDIHAGASAGEPVVLLHGWGFDRRAMAPLVEPLRALGDVWCVDLPGFGDSPPLAQMDLNALLSELARQLPARALVVGWSLGAVVAVEYAHRFPGRVSALVSLAGNGKFVASDHWPQGMAPEVNRQFSAGFARRPEATGKRFCALVAQGSPYQRERTQTLRQLWQCPGEPAGLEYWQCALQWLADSDLRAALVRLPVPVMHLLAEGDALVPIAAGRALAQLNPGHRVVPIADAGHALHWDQPQRVAGLLLAFARGRAANHLDKRALAQSFSRAAQSYDSAARLQRSVGEHLLSKVEPAGGVVLDLGSGTGLFTRELARRSGADTLLALDLAEGMLTYAREKRGGARAWLCADAQTLPVREGALSLIFSSLVIQWCENLQGLGRELFRALAPGGEVRLATLEEGTLCELDSAWRAVDGYVHVNCFAPLEALVGALAAAGFVEIDCERQDTVLYSDNIRQLSAELKALGAHNVNSARPRGLTGRHRLAALEAAYEPQRSSRGLPATYKVCYLSARRPR